LGKVLGWCFVNVNQANPILKGGMVLSYKKQPEKALAIHKLKEIKQGLLEGDEFDKKTLFHREQSLVKIIKVTKH
jgi:hypothetical protein